MSLMIEPILRANQEQFYQEANTPVHDPIACHMPGICCEGMLLSGTALGPDIS